MTSAMKQPLTETSITWRTHKAAGTVFQAETTMPVHRGTASRAGILGKACRFSPPPGESKSAPESAPSHRQQPAVSLVL